VATPLVSFTRWAALRGALYVALLPSYLVVISRYLASSVPLRLSAVCALVAFHPLSHFCRWKLS
jgi:hypothetical protein